MNERFHQASDATDRVPAESDQALALALAVAVRTAAYYDPDNTVLQQASELVASLLERYTDDEGSVTVGVHSHCVFVGKSRVRTSVSAYGRYAYLVDLFESRNISTLTFSKGIGREELMLALVVLAREHHTDSDSLVAALRSRGVGHVRVDAATGAGEAQAVAPAEAYAAAAQLSEEMRRGTWSAEPMQVRRLHHISQVLVDQVLSNPGSLIALTTVKDPDRYLLSHSANVAVFSVLLGKRLGLTKSKLGRLCVAAFLHDAGMLSVDPEVATKSEGLGAEDWDELHRHPLMTARAFLGSSRPSPSRMTAVVVAFEHHLNYDMSGYPHTEMKKGVTLFGNIVTIGDRYDAMTTARRYRDRNLTPPEVVAFLIKNAGTLFEPVLAKLFVGLVGVYPPGTVVELATGEQAVVCLPPLQGRPLDRPKVRLITGQEAGLVVDLDSAGLGAVATLVTSVKTSRSVTSVLNPGNRGMLSAADLAVFDIQR